MPEAAAADSTSLLRAGAGQTKRCDDGGERPLPSFSLMTGKSLMKRFAQQHATCTRGPSFPSHMPDATDRHCKPSQKNHGHVKGWDDAYQSKRFCYQRPSAQKLFNDETSKHSLYLGYTAVLCMYRILLDQNAGAKREKDLSRVRNGGPVRVGSDRSYREHDEKEILYNPASRRRRYVQRCGPWSPT